MKLSLNHLTHTYGTQTVLHDISLTLTDVQAVGIIGASGCGKSTLMRLLAGIEAPTAGDITLNGLSPQANKRALQSKIGYVFQKHNLFPHLSIYENLLLVLHKIKKIDRATADARMQELLCKLQIQEEMHKKPHEVSGGQAQRAAIARALCTNPDLLFLDEPTAALDPLLTAEVLHAVKTLRQSGSDFVFVTHELAFLRNFADYVIFMDQGRIVEHGAASILQNPQTPALQKFIQIGAVS